MQDRDLAVERVVAIDVIHLLKAEGNYSQSVVSQLEQSEVWQAYSRQRHDLFLPAATDTQVSLLPELSHTPLRGGL